MDANRAKATGLRKKLFFARAFQGHCWNERRFAERTPPVGIYRIFESFGHVQCPKTGAFALQRLCAATEMNGSRESRGPIPAWNLTRRNELNRQSPGAVFSRHGAGRGCRAWAAISIGLVKRFLLLRVVLGLIAFHSVKRLFLRAGHSDNLISQNSQPDRESPRPPKHAESLVA